MARTDLEAALRRMRAELQDESFTTINLSGAFARRRARSAGARAAAAAALLAFVARSCAGGGTRAPGNSIGPAGAAALAEALKINKTVTTIYLGCAFARRRARSAGARAAAAAALLAFVARSCAGGGTRAPVNSIGDAGAAALAEALKINKTVTTIDLSSAFARRRARSAAARAAAAARALMRGRGGGWGSQPHWSSR